MSNRRRFATAYELQALYEAALAERERQHGPPKATLDALMLCLRERGAAALSDPVNRDRLARMTHTQLREIADRLARLKAGYPAITDALLSHVRKLGGAAP